MAQSPERESYFPAIEAKYGQPMSYWFDQMSGIADRKYPEQIAYLRENHGFSQAHANALVMYSRGSTTSRKFDSFDAYLAHLDDTKRTTVEAIFAAILDQFPQLHVEIAWNQPMIKHGDTYVFGVSASKNHLTIAPFDAELIDQMRPRLGSYKVNKKTIQVPQDWQVDTELLHDLIAPQLR